MSSPLGNPANWSATNMPEGLTPIVGYLYWYLERGKSVQDAMQHLQSKGKFPRLSASGYDAVARIALQQLSATRAAQQATVTKPQTTIGSVAGNVFGATASVGVRVTLTVELAGGATREVSVLLNADSDVAIGRILGTASGWVRDNAASVWGSQYPVNRVLGAAIVEVVGIPWTSSDAIGVL